jgi:hypothetical protein
MGFKPKHLVKSAAKVANAVGNSGILGQRGNHFRVLGVAVPKKVVPVVQAAVVVAAAVVAGPAVAGTMAIPEAAAGAIVGAASSGVMAGVSGANESQMTKAIVAGGISGGVAPVIPSLPVPAQVAVSASAGAAAASVSGGNPLVGAIGGAIAPILPDVSSNNYVNSASKGALSGGVVAAVSNDNIIEGALVGSACQVVATAIHDVIDNKTKPDEKKEAGIDVKSNPEKKESVIDMKSNQKIDVESPVVKIDSDKIIAKNDMNEITNIKVARRGLHVGSLTLPYAGDAAHSAVIVTTRGNDKYLLEFMPNSEIVTTQLNSSNMVITRELDLHVDAVIQNNSWTVQRKGCEVNKSLNLDQAREIMSGGQDYSLTLKGYLNNESNVCHDAQERLRADACK